MFTNNNQLRIKASPMGLNRFKMSEEVDMVHEDGSWIGIIGLSTDYKSSMDEDSHERQTHIIKVFGISDPSAAQGINKAKQASKPRWDNTVSVDWDGLWLSTVQCRQTWTDIPFIFHVSTNCSKTSHTRTIIEFEEMATQNPI